MIIGNDLRWERFILAHGVKGISGIYDRDGGVHPGEVPVTPHITLDQEAKNSTIIFKSLSLIKKFFQSPPLMSHTHLNSTLNLRSP